MSHAQSRQTSRAAGDRSPPQRSRRWFLAGAGVIVVAAGGGVGVGLSTDRRATKQSDPPVQLVDAVAQERSLIADLDATTGGDFEVRRAITQARADHAAHLAALQALAATYGTAQRSTAKRSRGTPLTRVQLRTAEGRAASATATRAAQLSGAHATLAALLASIAACESTHADLFT